MTGWHRIPLTTYAADETIACAAGYKQAVADSTAGNITLTITDLRGALDITKGVAANVVTVAVNGTSYALTAIGDALNLRARSDGSRMENITPNLGAF